MRNHLKKFLLLSIPIARNSSVEIQKRPFVLVRRGAGRSVPDLLDHSISWEHMDFPPTFSQVWIDYRGKNKNKERRRQA
jgi:hypothetical protein